MINKRLIGKSVERVDAYEKITGKAIYIDDIPIKDGIYGAIIRSDVAYGTYLGYTLDKNFDWKDYTIVDYTDIIGNNAMVSVVSDHPFLLRKGKAVNILENLCLLIAS
jgi:xanthine dehydrogenase molybdopterin-binding subunit B